MNEHQIWIRQAGVADIHCMVGLLRELFSIEADFQFDEARQMLGLQLFLDGCGKHRCIHVAEVYNFGVVGMCTVQVLLSTAEGGPVAWIEDMVVREAFRKKGIGVRLLRSVEAWISKRGIHRIQLLADHANTPALEFYARHNWGETQLICRRKRV